MRIILEGPNLVEKGQPPECLNIGAIEIDSNLGPDLLEQAKRWRAHQRVADPTDPNDVHFRPAVGTRFASTDPHVRELAC